MTAARTYLDYNATAPLRAETRAAMASALDLCGNASSVHAEGRQARALVEEARKKVARLAGAKAEHVVFTSGGTEANVTGLMPGNAGGSGDDALCLVSAVEHPSVLAGGRFGPQAVRKIPVTAQGVVDPAALQELVAEERAKAPQVSLLVSVMVANNETGALQPVADVARIAHEHGAMVHADAVQAAGKVPVDMAALDVDMISLSGHKIGGPQGVGALVLASPDALKAPLMTGGGQEMRRRAGTENVAAVTGFGAAAELALRELESADRLRGLRDRLEAMVTDTAPEAVVFAREVERLPNTSCFAVPGMQAETLIIALDLAGIAVSAGSACSSGKVERSHVLEAMGVAPDLATAAIRVSLGWASREEDIDAFMAAWTAQHARTREQRSAA